MKVTMILPTSSLTDAIPVAIPSIASSRPSPRIDVLASCGALAIIPHLCVTGGTVIFGNGATVGGGVVLIAPPEPGFDSAVQRVVDCPLIQKFRKIRIRPIQNTAVAFPFIPRPSLY
jgi:hypothetical protein